MKISTVVLTRDEERNIKRCLDSLKFCDEIIVVDDFSTDKTVKMVDEVLKSNKMYKVFQRKLNRDFAEQRNFGMSKAKNDWILFIDADEEISEELKKEIFSLDSAQRDKNDAFYIKRRDYFWGKELKYGETKEVREKGLIRLVKKGSGRWQGNVHEIYYTFKNTGKLRAFINHYPHQDLKEFIRKVNIYSSFRAEELFRKGRRTNIFEIVAWPFGKFISSYFFNFGFLDGSQGFVYSFLMSFHSFLVRAKLYQML